MTSTIALIERLNEPSDPAHFTTDDYAIDNFLLREEAATELTTLLKRCDYWEKQYNETRALAWKTADERDALLERCEKAEAERDELEFLLHEGGTMEEQLSKAEATAKFRLDMWDATQTALDKAEARVAELSETFTDENGTVWSPPTAWAYYAVCQARNNWKGLFKASQTRAETAESQVKELTAERDALKTALKIYGAHANECSGRYGPECNCGWRELKI